jgi:IrrE N-terminal-like domain
LLFVIRLSAFSVGNAPATIAYVPGGEQLKSQSGTMKQLSLLEQQRLRRPNCTDVEHIESIAADTIRELEERAPVDLGVVASYHGIRDIEVVPLPVSGALIPEGGVVRMLLNSADSDRRRRFTGFHEVGHAFQPGFQKRRNYRCHTSTRPRESADPEALSDAASAALLLPADEFSSDAKAAEFGISTVVRLADHYQASVQATAYRFQRFWQEPTLLVVLEEGVRKAERDDPDATPKLRVTSAYPRGAWPYIPMNKSAAAVGPLTRAYQGELISERAGLDDISHGEAPDGLEVSARAFEYRTRDGRMRRRVLALYRQVRHTRCD